MKTPSPPDFEAEVVFLSPEEGGRKSPAGQQIYRPDIRYVDLADDRLWAVWPLFLDEKSEYLPRGATIPARGKAHFFIVNEKLRPFHRDRIKVGVEFFLQEGIKAVARCKVTRVLNLFQNGC